MAEFILSLPRDPLIIALFTWALIFAAAGLRILGPVNRPKMGIFLCIILGPLGVIMAQSIRDKVPKDSLIAVPRLQGAAMVLTAAIVFTITMSFVIFLWYLTAISMAGGV